MTNIEKTIFVCLPIFLSISAIVILLTYDSKPDTRSSGIEYSCEIFQSETLLHYYGVKDSLVNQVDKYIQTVAPGSCVHGIVLVEQCDKYNVDLLFVMAQGTLESHWGTEGIAAKTHSVFNVYSFDNMSAKHIIASKKNYEHPDHSIEPYLDLLTSTYLVNGKTEKEMFDKFVDSLGRRYATNKNYEKYLLQTYENINNVVNMDIYKEYKRMKTILGK